MNDRIDKIKKALKGSSYQKDFELFLAGLRDKDREVSQQMVKDVGTVLAGVRELMERRDQGFRDLHAYLEFQRKELDNYSDKNKSVLFDVIESLDNLGKALQKTQKVTVANPSAFKNADLKAAFIKGLDELQKVFVEMNRIPDSGTVEYGRDQNITVIEEKFGDKVIRTEYRYNGSNKVISWKTEIV